MRCSHRVFSVENVVGPLGRQPALKACIVAPWGPQPLRRRGSLASLEGRRFGLVLLVRVGLFASMVAPHYRPLRGAFGPPPGLRRSSSLLCLGRASALLSGAVLPPLPRGGRFALPRGPPLVGPRLCRLLPLLGLVGLLRGASSGSPPLGPVGRPGLPLPRFLPPPPPAVCSERSFRVRCGISVPERQGQASGPPRRAVLDPPSRLCSVVVKARRGRAASPGSIMPSQGGRQKRPARGRSAALPGGIL